MPGQRTQWNEATRVQMPALVHLTRIGYTYFGKITEDGNMGCWRDVMHSQKS